MCVMHYARLKRHGDVGPPGKYPEPTAEDRFWAKVTMDEETGCWVWATPASLGYGILRIDGRKTKAHRFAYELLEGPIPEGLTIDHLCRNRACVNPGHLEPVTREENMMRGEGVPARNARKTHCKRGHPLTGPEADLVPDVRLGRRICRKCAHIHRRTRYLRHGK